MSFWQAMAAVVIGAILGFGASLLVSGVDRKHAAQAELRRTVARFQAEAAIVVARLRELPPATESGTLSKLWHRVEGEQARWARTQAGLTRTLGADWRAPIERLTTTAAELRLMSPPNELREAIDSVEEYVTRLSAQRSDQLADEWQVHHDRLKRATEKIANSGWS